MGSGPAKNNECLVNDEDTKLAVKSNKFKFMSRLVYVTFLQLHKFFFFTQKGANNAKMIPWHHNSVK